MFPMIEGMNQESVGTILSAIKCDMMNTRVGFGLALGLG
jgi:hypothetical protein